MDLDGLGWLAGSLRSKQERVLDERHGTPPAAPITPVARDDGVSCVVWTKLVPFDWSFKNSS